MSRFRQVSLLSTFCALLLCACGGMNTPQAAQGATVPPLPATENATGASEVTVVSVPTQTATTVPSATPSPATATPVPTREPTETPVPTHIPTATPEPTAPPTPTNEPKSEVLAHVFPVDARKCTASSGHHDYPASDIACPMKTKFVAVTSGIVDYVSSEDIWSRATDNPADRGGISVAIVGDDGVRYYGSHLFSVADGITPGVRVEAGQILGLTGQSGNAAGTYPHLHFGISHPTTADDWQVRRGEVWPQKYLAAWKRGENVTPKLS